MYGEIKPTTSNTALILGGNPKINALDGDTLIGSIYSVRIYNRELTEKEVSRNFKYDKKKYGIDDYTIDNYENKGLQMYFLASNNTGNGYSSSATVWKDISNHGYNATLKNFDNTETSGWVNNNALRFDGSNDWCSIGLFKPKEITIEAVVELDSLPARDKQIDIVANAESAGVELSITDYGDNIVSKAATRTENSAYSYAWSNDVIKKNKKVYIAMTFNSEGKLLTIYNNGNKQSVSTTKDSITASGTVLALGTNPKGTSAQDSFLNGKIYSVRVYNRALTDNEINKNYLADVTKFNIDTTPDDGLRVYYDALNNTGNGTFDNTITSWADLSGCSNNGTIKNFNNTTSSGWQENHALRFDGSNDWVQIRRMIYPNFTYEAVVEFKNEMPTKQCDIVANWDSGGTALYVLNKKIYFCIHSGSGYVKKEGIELSADTKYHIVATYDGNTMKLYVNNNLIINEVLGVATYKKPGNNTNTAIGADPSGTSAQGDYLIADVYSVKIYNRALDASQVAANYQYQRNRYGF